MGFIYKNNVVKADDLDFDFYLPQKGEDAHPIRREGLLVVADGFGGSGSTPHTFKVGEKEKLRKAAFSDFPEDNPYKAEIEEALTEIFESDGEEVTRTSAFIASRIVSIRFAYGLTLLDGPISEQKQRDALAKYVKKGLQNVVDAFHFPECQYAQQCLLPSTLAALIYEEKEGKLLVDSVWAGDSRSYCLLPNGLRFLSLDDEDEEKYVNNYFHAFDKNRKEPYLNYRHFEFAEPVLIFAGSDGIFDPFGDHDGLGVTYLLTRSILRSDGKKDAPSKETGERMMEEYISSYQEDDTTIALHSFGFRDFRALKKALKPLARKVEALFGKLNENLPLIKAAGESEEERMDALSYVRKRTPTPFPMILNALTDTYLEGKEDIALTKKLRKLFSTLIDPIEAKKKAMANALNEAALSNDYIGIVFGENKPKREASIHYEAILKLSLKEVPEDEKEIKDRILAGIEASKINELYFKGGKAALAIEKAFAPSFVEKVDNESKSVLSSYKDKLVSLGKSKQDFVIDEVIDGLSKHPTETSVIDSFYNSGRLEAFRLRLRLSEGARKAVLKVKDELEAIEEECTILLDERK